MEKNKQSIQTKPKDSVNPFSKMLLTGFVGGLLWSFFGVIMYYFNFSEVAPKTFLLRSWLTAEWTNGWLGDVISILLTGIISLAAAIVYYGIFKKINSMWMGLFYGVFLWGVIFYLLGPVFSNVPRLVSLDINTIISTVCLFILYGIFIGYSISFDYHNLKVNEKYLGEAKS